MKQIKIKQLTLQNWRGAKLQTTVFNTDKQTTICGDNGIGKSRHFDAFCWLLFGKDAQDRKDFELRSYDTDHNILHRCECSVEGILLVDGQELTLKREYKEQWTKPRGQAEEVFSGNITECTWNGVPVKVSDYKARIAAELIDETIFKMITNPRFFTEKMKWQQQRSQLLMMAKAKPIEEIAEQNPDFKTLLDQLNGKSLADFRKELAAKKKRINAELDEIQPRIDQTQKMMPESLDWDAIQSTIDEKQMRSKEIDEQLYSIAKQVSADNEQKKQAQNEINKLQAELFALQQQELKQLQDEALQNNIERREIERTIKTLHADLSQNNIDTNRCQERITQLNRQLPEVDDKLTSLRSQWTIINASQYEGSDICPCCGQRLPQQMIQQAQELFSKSKQDKLQHNNEEGKATAQLKKNLLDEVQQQNSLMEQLNDKAKQLKQDIDKHYTELLLLPQEKIPTKLPQPTPQMQDCQIKIDKLINELNQQQANDTDQRTTQLKQQQLELANEINQLKQQLATKTLILKAQKEIESLNQRGRELAQLIADIEGTEYIANQLSKAVISDCEQRINNMFKNIQFKLFDYTQEGNEFEVCIPLINGTPYQVANTAAQINAGLEIIDCLTQYNNISAPVFIDSAESVNHFMGIQSQTILLQVTKDKELIVK